jgi:hypothetical protein
MVTKHCFSVKCRVFLVIVVVVFVVVSYVNF